MFKDGSLEISQAEESDTGFYKCVAKYRSLEFDSRQAYVKVNPKPLVNSAPTTSKSLATKSTPKFLISPEDHNVSEDTEIIFECLAFNDASLFTNSIYNNISDPNLMNQIGHFYKYKWLKDGLAIDFALENNKRFDLVQGVNLRIKKTHESDTGTYTCRICNSDLDESTYIHSDSDNLQNSDECDERSASVKVLGKLIFFY